jgi:predicted nucleotidyltransferase
MRVSTAHRRHWQERLAREREAGACRLPRALPVAHGCGSELKRRWPQIRGVWLFGSAIEGTFRMDSDIDLAVEGLPNLDLLDAMAEVESAAADIPVDLVRLESLPPHWQRRIRDRGRPLL